MLRDPHASELRGTEAGNARQVHPLHSDEPVTRRLALPRAQMPEPVPDPEHPPVEEPPSTPPPVEEPPPGEPVPGTPIPERLSAVAHLGAGTIPTQ